MLVIYNTFQYEYNAINNNVSTISKTFMSQR